MDYSAQITKSYLQRRIEVLNFRDKTQWWQVVTHSGVGSCLLSIGEGLVAVSVSKTPSGGTGGGKDVVHKTNLYHSPHGLVAWV